MPKELRCFYKCVIGWAFFRVYSLSVANEFAGKFRNEKSNISRPRKLKGEQMISIKEIDELVSKSP